MAYNNKDIKPSASDKASLKNKEKEQQQKVDEGVSHVNDFFNRNSKLIWTIVGVIVAVALIILCYQKFYLQPKKVEGQAQMFPAEASFKAGNYEIALNGDGNNLGFAEIESQYGRKAGESVYLYAGICELNLGKYEEALSYLKKYKGKDEILAARALACQGDAYVGLSRYDEALACYDKAIAKADNMFAASYLLKAGVVCEEQGNAEKALTYYQKIKDQYPQSMEGYDIDKYIERIKAASEPEGK
jgi:tetratricopeptide (TPR) repeat protein